MAYIYSEHRHFVFTEEGTRALCEALLDAQHLAQANGLIPHERLASKINVSDSWGKLAVIDRLVETGYLSVVAREGMRQDWIYRWIARSRP